MTTLDADSFPVPVRASASGDRPWLVLKFGGTSVSTAPNWQIIHDLLLERQAAGYRPVLVHSALAGVSNRIQKMLGTALTGDVREDNFFGIPRLTAESQEL